MYDPAVGRFLSEDPLGFAAGDTNLQRYVSNSPTNHTDPTGLLEADDGNRPEFKRLTDVTPVVEKHVNDSLRRVRRKLRITSDAISAQDREGFLRAVYAELGSNVRGSGVSTPKGSVARLTEIEVWLKSPNLKAGTQYVKLPFSTSRYRQTRIGRYAVVQRFTPPMFYSTSTANHGIAATIKCGSTYIGTDKFGHMFQQGYWYYLASRNRRISLRQFGYYLEGDQRFFGKHQLVKPRPGSSARDLRRKNLTIRAARNRLVSPYVDFLKRMPDYELSDFGLFGSFSTGIISFADMNANSIGYAFYSDLAKNPATFNFDVSKIDFKKLNERHIPNSFDRRVKAD